MDQKVTISKIQKLLTDFPNFDPELLETVPLSRESNIIVAPGSERPLESVILPVKTADCPKDNAEMNSIKNAESISCFILENFPQNYSWDVTSV